MKRKLAILSLALVIFIHSAQAHRLNEYLQATTVSLHKGNIQLHIRLTAGTDIAPQVLALIDKDRNNLLSAAEQEKYARSVLGDLTVIADGANIATQLQSWIFPAASEIKNGTGEIQLTVSGTISRNLVSHRIIIKSQHFSSAAVYLVNCLVPVDTTVHVTGQNRSLDQSVYTLDFTTSGINQNKSTESADHWSVVKTYFVQGMKHILNGYDHLLFLCALVLGAASLWDLIKIVTAFTVAHSLTLTLATFGYAHLPSSVVEPLIAASIVFVAMQNITRPQDAGSRERLAIAFFFGLFHGLGFAGGLLEVMHTMPVYTVVLALIGFSIGIEASNQLVLLPLYALLRGIKKIKTTPSKYFLLVKIASGLVATAGMYYLIIAACEAF
jgi:hydrogenase/urease accessory protein HupE